MTHDSLLEMSIVNMTTNQIIQAYNITEEYNMYLLQIKYTNYLIKRINDNELAKVI